MIMVWPSGGALATVCCATAPAPCELFSTMMETPSRSDSLSPSMRLITSGLPPGAVPTISLIGRDGHSLERAGVTAASEAVAATKLRRVSIMDPLSGGRGQALPFSLARACRLRNVRRNLPTAEIAAGICPRVHSTLLLRPLYSSPQQSLKDTHDRPAEYRRRLRQPAQTILQPHADERHHRPRSRRHDDQHSGGFPAPVNTWADAIRASDGVLIVTPEYNWTIPGGLKNAIDWVSRMKDQPFN